LLALVFERWQIKAAAEWARESIGTGFEISEIQITITNSETL